MALQLLLEGGGGEHSANLTQLVLEGGGVGTQCHSDTTSAVSFGCLGGHETLCRFYTARALPFDRHVCEPRCITSTANSTLHALCPFTGMYVSQGA